jgi:mono/diheme cytochrome c family protein
VRIISFYSFLPFLLQGITEDYDLYSQEGKSFPYTREYIMNKMKIFGFAVIIFGIAQIVPYGNNHNNPEVLQEVAWDSRQTEQLFYRACGDCHSNTTKWPWYSNVAPVSWLVAHDVAEGRKNFNVSMWDHQEINKGVFAAYQFKKGNMPPFGYLLNHPEAKLAPEDKEMLMTGLRKTFAR